MSSKSKRKGYTFEKEIETFFRDENHKAVKAWGSNGKSLGVEEDVDVIVNDSFYIQAKRRKALPKFLELGNCHAVFIREDRGTTKVLIPLDDRDLIQESLEEILDGMVYIAGQIIRLKGSSNAN